MKASTDRLTQQAFVIYLAGKSCAQGASIKNIIFVIPLELKEEQPHAHTTYLVCDFSEFHEVAWHSLFSAAQGTHALKIIFPRVLGVLKPNEVHCVTGIRRKSRASR